MTYSPKVRPQDKGMKPNDFHLVVSAMSKTAKLFTAAGSLVWERPALADGQHPNWRANRGDTPPGLYRIGQVYNDYASSGNRRPALNRTTAAYGWVTFDMVDLEGNEDGNGRAGICLHGGGSALPDPLADYQRLVPTHGCIRMHNRDLLLIVEALRAGQVYISVHQDDR